MINKKNIKFEGVNLFEIMGGIVEAHVRAYREDFDTDKEMLQAAAKGPSRGFLWLARHMGTWLLDERNVFLKATRESNTFRFYQEQTREPIILFAVEVIGLDGDAVIGNLYLLDYRSHYRHVLAESQEASAVMHYEDGNRIIPAEDITLYDDAEFGKLLNWDYLAESENDLSALLWKERQHRASFTVGDFSAYLADLEAIKK